MKDNFYNCETIGIEAKCYYCPEENTSTRILKIRRKRDDRLLSGDAICKNCEEDYNNNKLRECEKCGRVFKHEVYKCKCEYLKDFGDDDENKEGDIIGGSSDLERQLNELSLEHKQFKDDHVEAIEGTLEASKNWYDRKWEEEVVPLQEKSRRLSNENKQLKSKVEELETQLLGVEETSKKARRLSNENRILKEKVLGLETEVERYKGETSELKPGISQLKSDILELEAKLEKMISGTELQAQVEQPPKK